MDYDGVAGLNVGEGVDEAREVVVERQVCARLEGDAGDVDGLGGCREVDVPGVAVDGADVAGDIEGADPEGVTAGCQPSEDSGTGRGCERTAVVDD